MSTFTLFFINLAWVEEPPTGKYALDCDYPHENEIKFIADIEREECAKLCLDNAECTRYNWVNRLCVLKNGDPDSSVPFFNKGFVCGVIMRE